ncbi:Protein phosphatase [Mycena kentingensis (nom. inval.)]|nr:Protein phosphatase [Mycena kentingensis (nom. inval.)]
MGPKTTPSSSCRSSPSHNSATAPAAPSPCSTPGEDFFFVGQNYEPALNFGVADGVGGWAEQGADPSLFSQALMYHVDKISSQGKSEPADVLRRAYDALLNDDAVDVGSSTACILRVDASSGVLKTANLGDSGFCIYRAASASMFYISPAQTHYFNCPLQLSKVAAPGRNLSRNSIGDSPRQADVYETKLVDGDVVIAFTDGLSDNVFAAEIARICQMVFELQDPKASFAELIAYNLVHHARKRMFGNDPTPFEYEAKRKDRSYRDYTGGKIDDVTALVAIFKE